MGQVVLINGSVSPWAVPQIFTVAGHTVNLIGSGGNGGIGTSGTTSTAGGGGAGGAWTGLTYFSGTITPGTTTIAFLVNAGGSANATQWQSSSAGSGAFYEALSGGNANAGTAGTAPGTTTTVGTPTITYTVGNGGVARAGGGGGTGGGSNTLGGAGGGGSGGPAAAGGAGGTATSTGGAGGGGGGAANAGGNSGSNNGGTGGNGSTGAGGGSGATGGTGTGSSGGGGGVGGAASTGGQGGSGTDLGVGTNAPGCGGGGGGCGGKTTTGAVSEIGGSGGNFGGGGGGVGCQRTAATPGTIGPGAGGAIVIRFTSVGADWQPQPLPYPPRYNPKIRAYSALKHRSEFAYDNIWPNAGWEPTRSQEPRRKWEKWAAIAPKEDGQEWPFILWRNFGWEVQPPPPPHKWFRGHGLFGDTGIEAPFVSVVVAPPAWGFDIQQQPTRTWWRRAATFPWTVNIDAPFVNWLFDGFEQVSSQEPRNRWERRGAYLRGDDGSEATFIFWNNFGWEQTQSQPLHRFFRSPDIGDTGIEAPFVFTAGVLTSWGFEETNQGYRFSRRLAGALQRGIDGTEFPFSQWYNFFEQVFSQPPHRWRKSPETGDSGGFDFPFSQWVNTGWEVQPWQPPHRWYRGQGLRGDDGSAAQLINWINAGWEIQPPQPPHRWFRGHGLRGPDGTDAQLIPWFNWFDQTYSQPPHRWFRGHGLRGDDGTVAQFINWLNFGWEQTASQPLHKIWKSPDIGDSGIEAPFIFVPPPQFVSWGFEVLEPPFRHPRPERFAALVGGDVGNEFPYILWNNYGWDVQPPQPPRRPWERRGAILVGDVGNEAPYILWRNAGWEVQPWQPPRRPWERRGNILAGDVGNEAPYIRWLNYGWQIEPPFARHKIFYSPTVGDPGIAAPFTFVPGVGLNFFETPVPYVRYPRLGRSGALFPLGSGIETPFIPVGPPPVPPTGFHRIRRLTGKVFVIDTQRGTTYPPSPNLDESCVMVFNTGPGLPIDPRSSLLFTFIKPDGTLQLGDPFFAFISEIPTTYYYPFQVGQYAVYEFAIGELDQLGTWQVYLAADRFLSNTFSFVVT